jgi:hypothetical protein
LIAGVRDCPFTKQVFESLRRITRVTNLVTIEKNLHKIFMFPSSMTAFPNASGRYGDKWLAKRSFSRFFFRVTPADLHCRVSSSLFHPEPMAQALLQFCELFQVRQICPK